VRGARLPCPPGLQPATRRATSTNVALRNASSLRTQAEGRKENECVSTQSSEAWTRTRDPAVNSRLLYQLSYFGIGARKTSQGEVFVKRERQTSAFYPSLPNALWFRELASYPDGWHLARGTRATSHGAGRGLGAKARAPLSPAQVTASAIRQRAWSFANAHDGAIRTHAHDARFRFGNDSRTHTPVCAISASRNEWCDVSSRLRLRSTKCREPAADDQKNTTLVVSRKYAKRLAEMLQLR
jgi:hypothetical protein